MAAPTLVGALELLDRSLGYTSVALATVAGTPPQVSTPCAGWSLEVLLAHMEDALDAFTEGSDGAVSVVAGVQPHARVQNLQRKACDLLGGWLATSSDVVLVGGRPVPKDVVASAAALEITVHGWDVARATGADHPLPEALADDLRPVAVALVDRCDRVGPAPRFAPALAVPPDAPAAHRLLAHLGRRAS